MAITEYDGLLKNVDEEQNQQILYPITKGQNVTYDGSKFQADSLEEAVDLLADTVASKAPASHVTDATVHITEAERSAWSGKAAGTHANQHASSGIDPITPDSIGAAAKNHNHDASDIVSGILSAARGGTGQASLEALAAAMGGCKIATGSYTGTGTYGSSNPCSLTFDFVPKLVCISSGYTFSYAGSINLGIVTATYTKTSTPSAGSYTDVYAKKSSDGKTLYWYNTYSGVNASVYQLNEQGRVYNWLALG